MPGLHTMLKELEIEKATIGKNQERKNLTGKSKHNKGSESTIYKASMKVKRQA